MMMKLTAWGAWPFLLLGAWLRAEYRPLKRLFVEISEEMDRRDYSRSMPLETGDRQTV